MIVRCSSPTTVPRAHDPPLAVPHAATKVPQTPPPPAAGMDTDIRATPPLQTSCLPVSSIPHPPPRRKKKRRHRCRQNRRRRARSRTSIFHPMLLMRRLSQYRATIPVIREGPVMRCARPRACSVARSRRSGGTAHTDSGLMTVTCSCEQCRPLSFILMHFDPYTFPLRDSDVFFGYFCCSNALSKLMDLLVSCTFLSDCRVKCYAFNLVERRKVG